MFMERKTQYINTLIFKLINKINVILIKISIGFLIKLVKLILKFTQKCESAQIAKTNLR